MAGLRSERSLARFERVAVVAPGCGALGAYQAGALAAMTQRSRRPDWLAAIGTGAFNAAIVAGSPPGECAARLLDFWHRLGELMRQDAPSLLGRAWRHLGHRRGDPALDARLPPDPVQLPSVGLATARLRALLAEHVDFARVNAGSVRLTLGSTHLASGAEIAFDNDRHRLGLDHVMASAALPGGLPPVTIDGEPCGTGAVLAANPLPVLLDAAPPADTLCFILDGFDPAPPGGLGGSRSRQQIAAYRRRHELRRIIDALGERLPAASHNDPELRRCLGQGSRATMSIVHLVHESRPAALGDRLADFSAAGLTGSWRAGERDMAASLARSSWLALPPRRIGIVVHEVRGAAPRSRIR